MTDVGEQSGARTGQGRRMTPLLLATLVSLSVGGLMASDINLAGVPAAAADLGTSPAAVQQTFGLYMVGLIVAQLLYGPVSDAYGRRTFVLLGFATYAAASVLCAAAPSIELFTAGRLLEALGAGAGLAVGRAIVSDLFGPERSVRVFATIMPIVGVSPAVSPIIGGYLTSGVSWRAPFVLTAVIAAATIPAVLRTIPATMPGGSRRGQLRETIGNYPYLIRRARFWLYGVNLVAGYSAYFGYLVATAVIFPRLGLGPVGTSYCYLATSVTYVAGNLISRRLSATRTIPHVIAIGYALTATASVGLVVSAVVGITTPWPLLVFMGILAVANGFLLPMSYAGGVSGFPDRAASASGLLGALQMAGGAGAAFLIGLFPGSIPVLVGMIVTVSAVAILAFTLLYRGQRR